MRLASFLATVSLALPRILSAQIIVADQASCTSCSIEQLVTVRLGAAAGAGELPSHPTDIVIDSRHRYWLLFVRSAPMVFDSSGRFIATAGRRGPGPGEFDSPWRGLAVGDSVVVFDADGRITVVGPDLEMVRTIRAQAVAPRGAVSLVWPSAVLVTAFARSPDHVGWPLHLVDMSGADARVLRSFGEDDGSVTPGSRLTLLRHIIRVPDGTVWSADHLRYRLTEWTSDGSRVRTLLRQPPWFAKMSSGGPGSSRRPPDPLIAGIELDRAGLLWVFSRVPADDWRAAWDRVRAQYGRPNLPGGRGEVPGHYVPSNPEIYDTQVDVIDPRGPALVTQFRWNRYVSHVLTDEQVAVYSETPEGIPYIEIVRLSVRRR